MDLDSASASEARTSALPRVVRVKELLSSRYKNNQRPKSWEGRLSGLDTVRTDQGDQLLLASTGQQSPPHRGWILLLTSGDNKNGFAWTLYGLEPGADIAGLEV